MNVMYFYHNKKIFKQFKEYWENESQRGICESGEKQCGFGLEVLDLV